MRILITNESIQVVTRTVHSFVLHVWRPQERISYFKKYKRRGCCKACRNKEIIQNTKQCVVFAQSTQNYFSLSNDLIATLKRRHCSPVVARSHISWRRIPFYLHPGWDMQPANHYRHPRSQQKPFRCKRKRIIPRKTQNSTFYEYATEVLLLVEAIFIFNRYQKPRVVRIKDIAKQLNERRLCSKDLSRKTFIIRG